MLVNPSILEVRTGRSEVQGHLWLQSKFDTSQATRTAIKTTTKNKEIEIEEIDGLG